MIWILRGQLGTPQLGYPIAPLFRVEQPANLAEQKPEDNLQNQASRVLLE